MKTLSHLLVLLAVSSTMTPAAAQHPLDEAKAQYVEAAYEEALATLARAGNVRDANQVEVEQYRALCLLALGRTAEAERAVATLVAHDPTYMPPATIASPKVLAVISAMRDQVLPAIIRTLIGRGRAAVQEKAFARAAEDFSLVLQLLDEDGMKDWAESADVRVLAEGFVALVDASVAPPDAPPVAQAAVQGPAPETPVSDVPVQPAEVGAVQPPVPIVQSMPMWVPPDSIALTNEYQGVLKVRIGTDGRVKSASVEKPSHPSYDVRLLQAARQWVYHPATRNGQPVESEKVIAVQLHPRN